MKARLFWICLGIDALVCAIAVGFFFVGLADGSVSSFNIGIWTILLAVLTGIIAGSLWLNAHGHPVKATLLLLVLAVPALLCGLIILLALVSGSSWN
jgi:hypothetical protein